MTPEERASQLFDTIDLAGITARGDAGGSLEMEDALAAAEITIDSGQMLFTVDGVSFVLSDHQLLDGGGLSFAVYAEDVNGPLPVDDVYRFWGPPLGRYDQDPTFIFDPQTHTWVVDVPAIVTVDLLSQLQNIKDMVSDSVFLYAQQQGWTHGG